MQARNFKVNLFCVVTRFFYIYFYSFYELSWEEEKWNPLIDQNGIKTVLQPATQYIEKKKILKISLVSIWKFWNEMLGKYL